MHVCSISHHVVGHGVYSVAYWFYNHTVMDSRLLNGLCLAIIDNSLAHISCTPHVQFTHPLRVVSAKNKIK